MFVFMVLAFGWVAITVQTRLVPAVIVGKASQSIPHGRQRLFLELASVGACITARYCVHWGRNQGAGSIDGDTVRASLSSMI
jgi:hypothetical protein